ncbi:hypothetical protein Hanom_Chr17g01569491 [Helianthus anomalus]
MARVASNPIGLHKFRPCHFHPATTSLNPSVHSPNRKLRYQKLYCQTEPNPTEVLSLSKLMLLRFKLIAFYLAFECANFTETASILTETNSSFQTACCHSL